MGLEDVVWMDGVQDKEKWRNVVHTVINSQFGPYGVQQHIYLGLNSVRPEFEATKHWTVWHSGGWLQVVGSVAAQRVLSGLVGRKLNDAVAAADK